jgi:hypothetical protein
VNMRDKLAQIEGKAAAPSHVTVVSNH